MIIQKSKVHSGRHMGLKYQCKWTHAGKRQGLSESIAVISEHLLNMNKSSIWLINILLFQLIKTVITGCRREVVSWIPCPNGLWGIWKNRDDSQRFLNCSYKTYILFSTSPCQHLKDSDLGSNGIWNHSSSICLSRTGEPGGRDLHFWDYSIVRGKRNKAQ